jgi:hypothetical protein
MMSSWRTATWSCCTVDFQVPGYLQTGLLRILFDCTIEDSSSTGTFFRMKPLRRHPRAVCLCLEPRFPLRGGPDCSRRGCRDGHGPRRVGAGGAQLPICNSFVDSIREYNVEFTGRCNRFVAGSRAARRSAYASFSLITIKSMSLFAVSLPFATEP